jgi:hypothetical protein
MLAGEKDSKKIMAPKHVRGNNNISSRHNM